MEITKILSTNLGNLESLAKASGTFPSVYAIKEFVEGGRYLKELIIQVFERRNNREEIRNFISGCSCSI